MFSVLQNRNPRGNAYSRFLARRAGRLLIDSTLRPPRRCGYRHRRPTQSLRMTSPSVQIGLLNLLRSLFMETDPGFGGGRVSESVIGMLTRIFFSSCGRVLRIALLVKQHVERLRWQPQSATNRTQAPRRRAEDASTVRRSRYFGHGAALAFTYRPISSAVG